MLPIAPLVQPIADEGKLTEELAPLKKRLAAGPDVAARARQLLDHWWTDPDLAGVREVKELAKLPEAERKEWQRFWTDVNALRGEQ